ncbi:MAG TPA: hypothetical protein VGQ07_03535 [Nitrospirales bacterium]|nr:hypothetical protein [Nitrospirales bacterium]
MRIGYTPIAMVKLRDHEKMKALWPPYFEGPHSFWDKYHPGGEWGDLIRVKWVEPDRKGEPPYIALFARWDDTDFRAVFTDEDTAFLKKVYETLKRRGIGKTLEEVGNLQVDF